MLGTEGSFQHEEHEEHEEKKQTTKPTRYRFTNLVPRSYTKDYEEYDGSG